MAFVLPLEQAQTPNAGSRDEPFPSGSWQGVIEAVNERPFPDFVAENIRDGKRTGYANPDGDILSIQLGQNTGLEDQDDVGNRKMFVDFVIRDGTTTYEDVDVTERQADNWQLQKGARMLGNLANALDQITTAEANGKPVAVIADGFVEALREGAFNGNAVGFTVRHRPYKTRDGEAKVDASVVEFLAI